MRVIGVLAAVAAALALVRGAVANPLHVAQVGDCNKQLTKSNCLGQKDCCWNTGGLHNPSTHQPTCVDCQGIQPAEKAGLKALWDKWGYNRRGNLPDADVEDILCPNLGNIANHRVSCDDNGHLEDLLIGNDWLYGQMADVCSLTPSAQWLQTLTMSANFLYGTVPECVGQFTELRQFWLDHNFLRGKLPSLATLENLKQVEANSDCRLVSKGYLVKYFDHDSNCFDCGGGFDNLPPQCAGRGQFPNKCKLFRDQENAVCPTDNGDPGPPPEPQADGSCGAQQGTANCPCRPGNQCNPGYICSTTNSICLIDPTDPANAGGGMTRCDREPASIGCPCNALTGRCADATLKCRSPELVCVRASGAPRTFGAPLVAAVAALALATVAAALM